MLAGLGTAAIVADAVATQDAWGARRRVAVSRRDLEVGAVIGGDDLDWVLRPAAVIPDGAVDADEHEVGNGNGNGIRSESGSGSGGENADAVPGDHGDEQGNVGAPAPGAPAGTAGAAGGHLIGRVVVGRILRGEVVVVSRLAPDGTRGLAAQVPPRRVALAIPTDARTPPLEAAQSVDLYAVEASDGQGAGGRAASTADAGGPPSVARLARRAPVLHVGDRQITVAVTDQEAPALARALIGETVVVVLTGS